MKQSIVDGEERVFESLLNIPYLKMDEEWNVIVMTLECPESRIQAQETPICWSDIAET